MRRSEAERWLLQAENDLAFTAEGLRLGYTAQTCFMAQQSAEKAVKALHYHRGARVVLGHSVDALLAEIEAELPETQELRSGAKELDQLYVTTRYPNGLPELVPFEAYTVEQAGRALAHARKIVVFVREMVGPGDTG